MTNSEKPDAPEEIFEEIVFTAMKDVWNDWVGDTGCFPCDFNCRGGNGKLYFQPSSWASKVSRIIYNKTMREPGSVQTYPEAAKEACDE